jgi:hypothetical protein
MAPRRKEYELSVEQELPASSDGAPRRARLTARFSPEPEEAEPAEADLANALRELADRLARASEKAGLGRRPPAEERPDRTLSELLETYRPRQPELVELLHADGELTDGEYALLRNGIPTPSSEPVAASPPVAPPSAPTRSGGRPVEELLRVYQITSLRQAGAVRGRRQISFEEYMALKRHFGSGAATPPDNTASP